MIIVLTKVLTCLLVTDLPPIFVKLNDCDNILAGASLNSRPCFISKYENIIDHACCVSLADDVPKRLKYCDLQEIVPVSLGSDGLSPPVVFVGRRRAGI